MKYYSMNLSKEYVPGWDSSEIIREVGSNYIDAGEHKVISSQDRIVFESETDPGIDDLLVMGSGSGKSESRIGQFGEGLKCAALAATRRRNTSMVIESPRGKITFCFKKPTGFETPVLHAAIDASCVSPTFHTTVEIAGAADIYDKMFLPRESPVMIPKARMNEHTKIYCKGVFVTEAPDFKSRYHWNLPDLRLNRDRSIPDMWNVKSEIRDYLDWNMTKELATELLRHPETEEARAVGGCYWLRQDTKDSLAAAFFEIYGDKAVIQSEKTYTNMKAEGKGFCPVPLPDVLRTAMGNIVQTADKVVDKADSLQRIDDPAYAGALAEVAKLMDILDVPAEVRVYRDMDDGTMGHATWSADGRLTIVWLNERVMQPGHRTERLQVALHELAHIDGKATDESVEFERSLDKLAAKLAIKILG